MGVVCHMSTGNLCNKVEVTGSSSTMCRLPGTLINLVINMLIKLLKTLMYSIATLWFGLKQLPLHISDFFHACVPAYQLHKHLEDIMICHWPDHSLSSKRVAILLKLNSVSFDLNERCCSWQGLDGIRHSWPIEQVFLIEMGIFLNVVIFKDH